MCVYSQFLLRPLTHCRRWPTSISRCSVRSFPCSLCLPPSCLIDVCICGWSRTNRGLISYSFLIRSVNQTCEKRRRRWPSYHSRLSAGIHTVSNTCGRLNKTSTYIAAAWMSNIPSRPCVLDLLPVFPLGNVIATSFITRRTTVIFCCALDCNGMKNS